MKASAGTYKSIQVFSNPLLEKYSHVHPVAPFLVWAPVVAYVSHLALSVEKQSTATFLLFFFYGVVIWTLTEYFLHRYFFHLTVRGPKTRKTQFIIHGFHHEDANDPTRLVMTPIVSIVIGALFYGIFRTVFGPTNCLGYFAGFVVGYLAYDYIHYYVHFFSPKTFVGKYLKAHHMKHHYIGDEGRWGVSSPLWDFVFGTLK